MTRKIFADLARHTAPALRNVVALVAEGRRDAPVSPEGFGARELVCHMADNEQIVLDWIRLSIAEPGAVIDVPDAMELARKNGYLSKDVEDELRRFERLREDVCAFIENLDDEALDRHISCPFRGAVTVHDQCVFLLGHDVYHLDLLSRAALEGQAPVQA
ncbi:MAG: DinB family protein [Armatimonadetes bacterium]|nr:DinB family protein [Armatimonadota bacterium]